MSICPGGDAPETESGPYPPPPSPTRIGEAFCPVYDALVGELTRHDSKNDVLVSDLTWQLMEIASRVRHAQTTFSEFDFVMAANAL